MKALSAALAFVLLLGLAFSGYQLHGARADALREAGRAERLAEERATFEAAAVDATEAWKQAEVARISAESELDQIRARARSDAILASRAAQMATDTLRALFDRMGASQAPLDSLLAAHAGELAAVRTELAGVERLAEAQAREIQLLTQAWQASEAVNSALRAENASKDRQIAALSRIVDPGFFARLTRDSWKFVAGGLVTLTGVIAVVR